MGELLTNPAVAAAIFTSIGLLVLKIAESLLNRAPTKVSLEQQMRDELRLQISSLKEDQTRLQAELDATELQMLEWREKYYKQMKEVSEQLFEINRLKQQIVDQAVKLQSYSISEPVEGPREVDPNGK